MLFFGGSFYSLSLALYVRNLRQLYLSILYLFGFCILFQIPGVFHTVAISYDIPSLTVYRTLSFLCYFDATLALLFLLIHAVQWFVSARLDSYPS